MYVYEQRLGMGLLEYQALPSLPDVAHGGVLSTFSKRSAPDRGKCMVWSVRADGMDRPYITSKITTCWGAGSLSSGQPGGPPCWASPLAFGLICEHRGVPFCGQTVWIFFRDYCICCLYYTWWVWQGSHRKVEQHARIKPETVFLNF